MRLDLKHGQKEQNGFIIADCVFQFEAQLEISDALTNKSVRLRQNYLEGLVLANTIDCMSEIFGANLTPINLTPK